MLPFPIITDLAPTLRERSRELTTDEITTPDFQAFLDRLIFTMYESNGVGLAAPQVAQNIRAIAVDLPGGAQCFMNPQIVKTAGGEIESDEGCLSVPGKYGIVMRHKRVTIHALNRHGRRIEFEVKHFPAVIFQHEIDHLDGILFIDKAIKIIKAAKRHI